MAGALERCDRRCRGQQLAQHDRSRHADAFLVQVELRDAVLTQGDEWDPTEVGHYGMLEHSLGQSFGAIARDTIVADTASRGKGYMSKGPGRDFAVCLKAGHGKIGVKGR